MLLEARQTTLDGYFRRDPYARRAFGGRHRVLHYVTNIILHNPNNALKFWGTDDMHYYNFNCSRIVLGYHVALRRVTE